MLDKKLKILILSEEFPPRVGGVAQWTNGIARGLSQNKCDVTIITRYDEEFPPEKNDTTGFNVRYIRKPAWRFIRHCHWKEALKQYLAENTADLILATTWTASRGIVNLAHNKGIKVLTVVHGVEVAMRKGKIGRFRLRRTLMHSSRVVAVSRFTKDYLLEKYSIPFNKVVILPNGVDVSFYYPTEPDKKLRSTLNIPNHHKILLTLTTIEPRKGQDMVIQALKHVRNEYPDFTYVVAGPSRPEFLKRLIRLADKENMRDIVRFIGHLTVSSTPQMYNLCDAYIMASREIKETGDIEGFGITYLEANACGKPVIGGRTGGVSDAIIHEKNGLLVDSTNEKEIAESILKLLSDSVSAKKMADYGLKRVRESFTWKQIAGDLIRLAFEEKRKSRTPGS